MNARNLTLDLTGIELIQPCNYVVDPQVYIKETEERVNRGKTPVLGICKKPDSKMIPSSTISINIRGVEDGREGNVDVRARINRIWFEIQLQIHTFSYLPLTLSYLSFKNKVDLDGFQIKSKSIYAPWICQIHQIQYNAYSHV